MKPVILCQSKYGSSRRYADWLAETLACPVISTKSAEVAALTEFDTLLLGGGIYASNISGIGFLQKNFSALSSKRIFVFAVGAMPASAAWLATLREHNLTGALSVLPLFHLPGAWDESVMNLPDKMICKMIQKISAKQDAATADPGQAAIAAVLGTKQDWTDRAALAPLLAAVQEN